MRRRVWLAAVCVLLMSSCGPNEVDQGEGLDGFDAAVVHAVQSSCKTVCGNGLRPVFIVERNANLIDQDTFELLARSDLEPEIIQPSDADALFIDERVVDSGSILYISSSDVGKNRVLIEVFAVRGGEDGQSALHLYRQRGDRWFPQSLQDHPDITPSTIIS